MIPLRRTGPLLLLLAVMASACAPQPAAEASADAVAESLAAATPSPEGTASPSPSATAEPTEEPTPSPTAETLAACDLVLADVDGPEGGQPGEPRHETLDDLRAERDALADGSPGRAAADLNVEAYEEMGLVER